MNNAFSFYINLLIFRIENEIINISILNGKLAKTTMYPYEILLIMSFAIFQ